jgi:hypothetical protein
MAKLIKLLKSDELVDVIKKIKGLKGDEAVFEVPVGSKVFKTQHNLSLIKKSAGALGKTIIIRTDDEEGRSLAVKAGLLTDENDDVEIEPVKTVKTKKVRFSDIGAQTIRNAGASRGVTPIVSRTLSTLPSKPKATPLSPPLAAASIPPTARAKPSLPKRPHSNFSKFFILGVIVLVLVVFGLAVLLPQARIVVYARSEPITRDIEVSVDKSIRSINSGKLTIPAEAVTREVSHTKNFQTTGVKLSGTKATGNIQLYNFTKNTLTLRAATTTLIVDGKKYSFTKDVTGLRPTARIGVGTDQEIDESSLIPPVAVVAQEVGANFNLAGNIRLEVQNAALGQADVYAMTAGSVAGGTSVQTKILSQQDIDNATVTMQNELGPLVQAEIAAAANNNSLVIEPGAVKSEILAKTANKDVGAETDYFDMTIIARVTGISYNREDVKTLVLEKINSVLSEDKYLPSDGKQELTASFKAVDLEKGTGVLAVHFETVAAYKVENTNLSRILAGKSAVEIKEILLTKPEIDRVDVRFSPFFVNKAPRFNGKIYIETIESQD